MFLRFFIVLAADAIISSVNTALGSPNATVLSTLSPAAAPRLTSGSRQNDDTSSQFMTANDTTDVHTEERLGPSASLVQKAKSLLVDDVFQKLSVFPAKDRLFESPQLVWHYTDEGLLDMIETAMKNPSTATIAKKLQTEAAMKDKYRTVWTSNNAFAEQKISKATDNLLTSGHFQLWRKYLDRFNQMHPKQKTTVIDILLGYYTDEALAQMLSLAKKNPSTEKLKDPTEVSKLLNAGTSDALLQTYVSKYNWAVNSAGINSFDKPQLETWLEYVDFFKTKHPGTQESTNTILTARYGDEALAKMIIELKAKPDTAKLAKEMETELMKGWMSSQTSPHLLFELLDLKGAGDDLLADPLFSIWVSYQTRFGGKNPQQKTSLFEALMEEFDDDALTKIIIVGKSYSKTSQRAKALKKTQLSKWLEEKQAPNTVYKWLKVKGTAANSVERLSYLKYWKDYKAKHG
ncbi:hypothetical protein PHYSODRAFT_335521 [Phytophthora sojae]|uniref:RxLR effector PexRD54 WY domain-containing protein n=1 Tax=Phytophthora sojae (strain P6497) TaxID=1094619 RepID=G4ZRA7_PHYSP|nr:hypothetical protein PHYSODRAFT_335521 [Phytophthora sojae]EGZ13792.1 hypothetical protein PHYSODRAFT_335521 [Phytophthora sojae]|eukprot:XP_009531221.1 hypothetical protein PHYSODRAFT_335521 [Phytophthora sojae]